MRSSILKRTRETLVPAAIVVNFFSSSQRIALIHYFPLEVKGGRFLSLLVAFRNTATRKHSEIKQNRSTTKQEIYGEALSKQNIEDWLTSLSCSSFRVTTEWSAIFAFGVLVPWIGWFDARVQGKIVQYHDNALKYFGMLHATGHTFRYSRDCIERHE